MRTTTQIALSEQVRHRVLPLVAQVIDEATEPRRRAGEARHALTAAMVWGPASRPAVGSAAHGALDSNAVPLSPAPPLRQLWEHADRHRPRVVLATIFSVLNKICDIAPELLIGAAVDVVVGEGQSFIGTRVRRRGPVRPAHDPRHHHRGRLDRSSRSPTTSPRSLWRNLAQDIEHEMRMDAYRHVQELELAYFEDRSSGGLMAVLNDDVNQLERFLDVGANQMILTITNVVFVGLAFFIISPAARAPRLPADPGDRDRVAAATRRRSSRATTPCGRRPGGSPTRSPTTSAASPPSRPSPPRSARSSGSPSTAGPTARPTREAIRLSSAFIPLIRMAILAGFTVTLVVGGTRRAQRRPRGGRSTPSLVYMTQRLLWPLTELGETLDLYQRAMASCRRIFGLLDVEPEHPARHARPPRAGARRGALRRRARSPTAPAATSCTASTSRSPPARPTPSSAPPAPARAPIVKLLLRLYEPTAGPDLHRRRADRRAHLRARCAASMGFVSQDVFLFQGTVRENLTYGRPDATDDDVVWAATPGRGPRRSSGAARRLRHHRRRARPEALRRPAPAAHDRPGDPARPGDPRARRGHLGRRQRDRGGHPAVARPRVRRPHHDRDRPPPLDGPPRPPHPRARGRPDHRGRHPRGARRRTAASTPPCGASRPARPTPTRRR